MKIQISAGVRRIQEITELHNQIDGYLRMSLSNAIRIGELLAEQKSNIAHGDFIPWVNNNLPFTDRTARNYMRIYHERETLKTENVSVLSEGYRLLAEHANDMADMPAFDRALYYSKLCCKEMAEILNNPDASLEQVLMVRDASNVMQNEWAEYRLRLERKIVELLPPKARG